MQRIASLNPPSHLPADPGPPTRPAHQLGWRVAVLPFRGIDSPLGGGIALGMAEEISVLLARFRAPHLIATATFWDGDGLVANWAEQCRIYRLDYVVTGTIQVVGDRVQVRVTLQDVVLDFETIWVGRFEGGVGDLFSLQDHIASGTVAQIDPELFHRTSAFPSSGRTDVAAAHHAVLTAIQGIYRLDRASFLEARNLLATAIDLDSSCAAAHAWMAYWGIMVVAQGWAQDPRAITFLAGQSAERAMLLDPLDARAVAIAGHVTAYLMHDVRAALRLHARAVELNPNLPIAWTLSSWSKIYIGEHAAAVRHAQTSISLSPRDPHIFAAEHVLMTAHFFRRHMDEAERMADAVMERNPDHVSALNVHLAILGHMGRRAEAGHLLGLLQASHPGITVDAIAARAPLRPNDLAFYMEGLRRAGVPS